jgi:hypothetical protein
MTTSFKAIEKGLNLAMCASRRANVFQISQAIAQASDQRSHDVALRLLIQLADNLRNADPSEAVGLALPVPEHLPEPAWANAIAGFVEHCLISRNLPVPQWTQEYAHPLVSPVRYDLFDGWVPALGEDYGDVPEPLRARGILIEGLESI